MAMASGHSTFRLAMAIVGFGHSTFALYTVILFTQTSIFGQIMFMQWLQIMCLGNCFNFKRSFVNVLPLVAVVALPLTVTPTICLHPYVAISVFKACRRP